MLDLAGLEISLISAFLYILYGSLALIKLPADLASSAVYGAYAQFAATYTVNLAGKCEKRSLPFSFLYFLPHSRRFFTVRRMINSAEAESCINFTLKRLLFRGFFIFCESGKSATAEAADAEPLCEMLASSCHGHCNCNFISTLLFNWGGGPGSYCRFHESNMTESESCYLQFSSYGFFCAHMCAVYFFVS